MRIGIDNISPGEATSRQGPGGMRAYLQSLLECFALQSPQHQYLLFTPDWADPLLDELPPNVEVVTLPGVPINRANRIMYQQTAFPAALNRHRLDVFFATATVAPLACRSPVVLAVQFTQFYQWPNAYGRFRTAYLKLMLPLSLRKARQSIIFTENAKDDLIRWTGVSPTKVQVVPHGLSNTLWHVADLPVSAPEHAIGASLTGGKPYILYISATYGYKNHDRLIRAFGLLKQRRTIPHVLLLVGSEVTVSFASLQAIAAEVGVAESVIFAGRQASHDRVMATHLGATMAVVPTLYETFGFPVLEAMACGCPVVTSNCGSMAELAGESAILVDPYDIESISNGMAQLLQDSELRQSLIEQGRKRASVFTWEQSAALTLQVLERAAHK